MEKPFISYFFLYFLLSIFYLCETISCEKQKVLKAPNWSETYSVKGILSIPYAEISEPFYAWFDEPSKKSRIDYYGGMVKTYQLGDYGDFGSTIKLAPITTEKESNVMTCLQVNGTNDFAIKPQTVLPSLIGFECIGSEMIDGVETEKWQMVEKVGLKVNKYTMWLIYKNTDGKVDEPIAVPIRYEMKGYNSLLGSHYDHYYLEYEEYSVDSINPTTFDLSPDMICGAFPGPGVNHLYTFNPMGEFVHPVQTAHVDFEFEKFLIKHGKKYPNESHKMERKEIFRQNLRFIHSINRQSTGFSLGVNHLADKTELELKAYRGKQYSGVYNGGAAFPYQNIEKSQLPPSFDWRIYGAVTPVKDQSVCGSCWSFGTVGAIEGAYFLKTKGTLVRLSQQALVDCSWGFGNNGCDGGEDFRSYQWMMKHGGIPAEDEYGPYLGQDGYCHIQNVSLIAPITGYVNITPNNEEAFKFAMIKHGPISVAIDASHRTFSFYSNGVYFDTKCGNEEENLDHAVLAVGYGKLNGKDYWLIKNSWSNYWGNDGYVLMSAEKNNCGVMTTPTYVTM